MPLIGRSFGSTVALHCAQRNRLLAITLTERPLVAIIPEPSFGHISFRDQRSVSAVQLRSRYGRVALFVRETFDALTIDDNDSIALRTIAYDYTLQPRGDTQPLLRWEFERDPDKDPHWSRNHLQGPIQVTIGSTILPLNDWHLPTGWVTLEDIIRFCIVDLEAEYRHRADNWHDLLRESRQEALRELMEIGDL